MMDDILQALGSPDLSTLDAIGGQPAVFLTLMIVLGVTFLVAFFVRLHWALKIPVWLVFLACDAVVLYLVFGAPPPRTDYDYGPTTETPVAAVALTTRPQSSDDVCVPVETIDLGHVQQVVDSYCSNGGSPAQNYFVPEIHGDQLCYNVTAEPHDGQQCRISAHFRSGQRTPRDGLLLYLHRRLGREDTSTNISIPRLRDLHPRPTQ